MAFPVTLNGRTYTLTDFEGTNYVDGLPDAFEDFVTHAGDIYNSTSTTSNSIGTGSKTFTVEANKPYQAGTPLRIADAAAPSTNFLDTVVTSYSGTTLVVNSIGYGGSGTKTSWTVNIGGAKTIDGTLGVSQGGTGATTAAAARTNLDTYSKTEADSRFLNVSGEASDVTMTGNVTIGDASSDSLTINANVSGDVAFDTDTLYVDSTNDRVGINAGTSPTAPLVVNHTGTTGTDQDVVRFETQSGGDLKFQASDLASANPAWKMYTPGGEEIIFGTSGTDAMRIDSSQRVLIGQTDARNSFFGNNVGTYNPRFQIEANNTSNGARMVSFVMNDDSNNGFIQIFGRSRGTTANSLTAVAEDDNLGIITWQGATGSSLTEAAQIKAEVDGAIGPADMPGRLVFRTTGDGNSSSSERMRINNAGDVKIGSGDPTERLHVDGEVRIEGQLGANLYVRDEPRQLNPNKGSSIGLKMQVADRNGNASWASVYARGSDGFSQGSSIYFTTDYTTGSEPDFSSGNIPSNVRMVIDRSGNLLVGTTASPNGTSVYGSGFVGETNSRMVLRCAGSTTAQVSVQRFYNPNGQVGEIKTQSSSTLYVTSSDYRLKENVVELTGATDRLKQLNPSRFNFIVDADTTVDGFLAHEVQAVVPEAITGAKDAVDADGNPEYQGIDQSKLVPLLVATIKELEARITALENA